MKLKFVALVVLLLSGCAARLPDPCDEGTRDGGIGGTGQCEQLSEP